MQFLSAFPAKELSPGSSSSVHCPRRIAGDLTVPIKVYKTTSGMEDVNSPPFHQRTSHWQVAGPRITKGGPLSQNMQLHSGNPCHRTQWTKELAGLPKGIGQWKKISSDLLSIKASAVAEPATHCRKTGKGGWEVLGYAFPLPYTLPLISATGQWWRQYWSLVRPSTATFIWSAY